jgi:hypothetical protein
MIQRLSNVRQCPSPLLPPRRVGEPIVNRWLLVRYCVVGTYVGVVTVGGALWWYLAYEQVGVVTVCIIRFAAGL